MDGASLYLFTLPLMLSKCLLCVILWVLATQPQLKHPASTPEASRRPCAIGPVNWLPRENILEEVMDEQIMGQAWPGCSDILATYRPLP